MHFSRALMLLSSLLFLFSASGCGSGTTNSSNGDDTSNNDPVQPNIVFVTSVTGTGDLSSWSDSQAKTGLEAADAICQARADAAGLEENFIAWLSDHNDDAYCRIHNLNGTKFSNCGQSTLPNNTGPWIRTDGHPFSGGIDQLLWPNGKLYVPVGYDEFGNDIGDRNYFTATPVAGGYDTSIRPNLTCSNWTSSYVPGPNANLVSTGNANVTSYGWTSNGNVICGSSQSLLCFEAGAGPDLPDITSNDKIVFITSDTGLGNLSSWADSGGKTGLDAADSICQARATDAGLTGNFKAWLSTSTTNAIDRLSSNGPWVRVDGVTVANSKTDLTDGSLFTSINVNETGQHAGQWAWTYTGTGSDGIKTSNTCDDWTNNSSTAELGLSTYVDANWTNMNTFNCTSGGHLYCIED